MAQTDERAREQVLELLDEEPARADGEAVLGDRRLRYTVHGEFLPVIDDDATGGRGEPQAAVWTTAYLLDGEAAAQRPVCFAFNGGPGSSSIWLHFGALGPKRVVVNDDGTFPPAPYLYTDNKETWLEFFDLVFIDPPHTGWSITASRAARAKMLGVDGDVEALAEVIRVWLTRHRRWGSRVYLAGESYGTLRGAALAEWLQAAGVALSGVVLISCAMDYRALLFQPCNDLPYSLCLPALACVAQYHGLLHGPQADSPAAARHAAEEFVRTEYVSALQAGARLGDVQRTSVVARIAELTGLPDSLVRECNMRISDDAFRQEALRAQGEIVATYDARFTGPIGAQRQESPDVEVYDVGGPFTSAALAYFEEELKVRNDQRYKVYAHDVARVWAWPRQSYACTSPHLARALRRNPHLRVFVASGYYDLATPYSATDWSVAQLNVPADVLSRVTQKYYDAGHMMYTRAAERETLKSDLRAWLGALP